MTDTQDEKQVVRPTQIEVHFKALSETDETCDNCRYCVGEDFCHLIENHPADISQKSVCDKWELRPGDVLPTPVADEPAVSESEPAVEDTAKEFIIQKSERSLIQSVADRLTQNMKLGSTVFRDASGRRYMSLVSSNAYEDRESETMSSKALQRYVDSCWLADDYFRSDNVHQVWHNNDLTVGDIVWANMAGPFLVEVSKERDDIVSQAAWDYWETEEGRKDLGTSIRYWRRKQDKDSDGTLNLISKFETSTLPRKSAANLLTFSGVVTMSKSQEEYLDGMFGIEGVAELLKEGPQKLAAALAEKGIEHKSVDEPTGEEAIALAAEKFSPLLAQMVEDLADVHARFDTLTATTEQKDIEVGAKVATLETQLKALSEDNTKLRAEMANSPRASQATATEVVDEAARKAIEEKVAEYDTRFPGMQVPVEK